MRVTEFFLAMALAFMLLVGFIFWVESAKKVKVEQTKQSETQKPKYIVHQYNDAGQLLREWKTIDYPTPFHGLVYFNDCETNKEVRIGGGIIQCYQQ